MPDSPEITKARETGDPMDWAIAFQATVDGDRTLLEKDNLVGWMMSWFANAGTSMVRKRLEELGVQTHPVDTDSLTVQADR